MGSGTTILAGTFAATAVPLAVIDGRTRLPNVLVVWVRAVVVCSAVGVTLATDSTVSLLLNGLGGAVLLTLFHLALYVALPGQLGGGDVKLSVLLGFTLGWYGWPILVTGLLLGWLRAALYVVARRGVRPQSESLDLPLGPFLIAGALASILL